MKNFRAWLQIILCSLLLLVFVLTILILLPGFFNNDSDHEMLASEIFSSTAGFVVFITLSIIGLRNGIKKVKKEKAFIPFNEQLDLHLKGKIEYHDYRNLILGLTVKRPFYLVFICMIFLYVLTLLINPETFVNQSGTNFLPFVFCGILIISPLFTLIQIKKMYATNKIFHQHLTYHLTNEVIYINSETVNSTQHWSHFYKIKETNKFFLLYSGNTIATLLDKKMFQAAEIETFKRFIDSLNVTKE